MGVFDKASLALVPDGIKDGKLYSIKPTDGSGDFTFNRGSNLAATRVDENGLIEKGRGNLLLHSNQFDTTWTLSSGLSLTSGQSGYDGGSDAWLLENSTSSGRVLQAFSNTGVYTISVYAKAGNVNLIWLNIAGGAFGAYFDLSTGSVGSTQSLIGGQTIKASIEDVGNGWYRCMVAGNYGTASNIRIYPSATDGDGGAGAGSNIYIQDAQLEQGLVATDYIETGATTAQAGILEDLPRIDYTGGTPSLLLEPSRTNLVEYSEYFEGSGWNIQANTTTAELTQETLSPEGLYNAYKFAGNGSSGFFKSSAGTSGGENTKSIYLKAAVNGTQVVLKDPNQTITSKTLTLTTDWVRYELTETQTSFFGIWIDDIPSSPIYAWGAQVEQGSYATSYIPTYGATATRGEDTFQNNTNDKPLGAIGQGTWFVELQKLGDDSNQALYLAPTTNNTQQIRLHFDTNNARFRDARNGYLTIGGGVNVKTSMTKMALSIDTTSGIAKVYVNGSQLGSDYTLQANTFEFSRIVAQGKGFILKQSLFFPNALSDAELAALTT